MSNFYVPLNYSDLIDFIPPGEEVVYSTLCNVNKTTTGAARIEISWKSHVLLTKKGVGYTTGRGGLIYAPWSRVHFLLAKFRIGGYYFTLERDPNLETPEDFVRRATEFVFFIRPIKQAGDEYWKTNFPSKKALRVELDRIVELHRLKIEQREKKIEENLKSLGTIVDYETYIGHFGIVSKWLFEKVRKRVLKERKKNKKKRKKKK